MSVNWRIEEGIISYKVDECWKKASVEEIYYSAFGGNKPVTSKLPEAFVGVKEAFPNIRFSKFAVSPALNLSYKKGKIHAELLFERRGKQYRVMFNQEIAEGYCIRENVWMYFSGEYEQIKDILGKANVEDVEEIKFSQFIHLLNYRNIYPSLKITEDVSHTVDNQTDGEYQPQALNAHLYEYQSVGYKWLKYVTDGDCGCILGDEMGLGKTIQVISLFIEQNSLKNAPFLVVAPLSLLENWKREIKHFAPHLKVLVHHGSKRTGRYLELNEYDVVVTSYGATITDLSLFEMINWDILVLDEAQNIKNPKASRTLSIKQIPHRASISVTGTPFENHLMDIWSLIDFSLPGCLGNIDEFNKSYTDDITGAEKIEPILTSLMLRRKVKDVAKDLPEKVVISQPLVMGDNEAMKYEDLREEIINSTNPKSATLAALTKLRMFCTHPFLTQENKTENPIRESTKYMRMCEILEEIIASHEKVILFTSYTEMFGILKEDIAARYYIPVYTINGSTEPAQRQIIVDSFSEEADSSLLVLNPRAAGTGLNITAANYVIHYNLEWNPSLEDQATARAYRRGQGKTVFVYRLFYENTVEEIVNEKIESKRDVSEVAVIGNDGDKDAHELILKALGVSPL